VANSTPAGIIVQYDDSGGVLRDITQFVLTINGINVEQITEEKHSFGDSWEETLAIGIARMQPVELGGLYDDAALGPDALFVRATPDTPVSPTRTLVITWRSGKTTTVETVESSYQRAADRNALTKYTARLQPTGAVTEA
jgi:hypothetical protein